MHSQLWMASRRFATTTVELVGPQRGQHRHGSGVGRAGNPVGIDGGRLLTSVVNRPAPSIAVTSLDDQDDGQVRHPKRAAAVPVARAKAYDPVVSVLGSELCRRILRILLVDPQLELDAVALPRMLGAHPRTVSLCLNDLARAGLVAKQRSNQFMSYRAIPGLRAILETMIVVPPNGNGFPAELICVLYGSRSAVYRGMGA
jgi:hypothetical protein